MRTFNVSFLAVLSCIAMIGATPLAIGNGSPDPPVVPDAVMYVALQQFVEVLT